ncbi:YopX family protein [Streptococcus suis]|uniref:YopX family protein n=1 Tax=Streptococcus suis TaxID=1307 RepID=UPI000CF5801B
MIPKYRVWVEAEETMHPVIGLDWSGVGDDLTAFVPMGKTSLRAVSIDSAVLMQSTGKMDSTGKVEVFVGDILYYPDQDEDNYGIIKFDEDLLAFVLDNGYEKFIYGDYGMDKVVGNIYQNKDLADYILGDRK